MKYRSRRLFLVLLTGVIAFIFTSCSFIQIKPSVETDKYYIFGRDLGTYLKNKRPHLISEVTPYVSVALDMSNEKLLETNVLQTAFEYVMEKWPDDSDLIFAVKSLINLLGIKIDVSQFAPEELPTYAKCIRAVLRGFADVTS